MKALIAVLLMFGGAAQAADERIEIKGLRLGMSATEFTQTFNKTVHDDGSAGIGGYGGKQVTIAGVPVSFVSLHFVESKELGTISWGFSVDDYEQVKMAIASKYNLSCVNGVVQNGFGQRFDQQKCTYSNKSGDSISLTKRSERDRSFIFITSAAATKEYARKQQSKVTAASRDL